MKFFSSPVLLSRLVLRLFAVVLLGFAINDVPLVSAQAGTGTIRVAPSGSDSAGCGADSSPCRTIQFAVDQSISGGTIKLAQGTYTGVGSNVIDLNYTGEGQGKNLTIIGGYTPPNWSIPTDDPALTIIDGQNARRVMRVVSVDSIKITLQNITIQNGLVNENNPVVNTGEFSGGGLLCRNDNPNAALFVTMSMSNVVFKDNQVLITSNTNKAVTGGGASFYFRCSANLNQVTFENNSLQAGGAPDSTRGGQALGGGFFMSGGFGDANQEAKIQANGLTLLNNTATAGSGGTGQGSADGLPADALGGGAAIQLSRATLNNVTAIGNQAIGGGASASGGTASGGGLFFELNKGTVSVIGGTLKDNSVIGGASPTGSGGVGSGGALMTTDNVVVLERLSIINNRSIGGAGSDGGDAGGGGLYLTKFQSNTVSEVTGSNLIIADNHTEAGTGSNRFGGGGGIFSQDTVLTLSHVTMSNNSILDTMQGAALIGLNSRGSSVTSLSYSIVANHDGRDIFNNPRAPLIAQKSGDTMNLNYVLFHNNTLDFNTGQEYSAQPGLSGAVFNVSNKSTGDPAFLSPGTPDFDYKIASTSAAINAAVGSSVTIDALDNPRPFDSVADLGAIEFAPIVLAATAGDQTLALRWTVDTDLITTAIDHYEIVYSGESGADPAVEGASPIDVGTATDFTLSGLTNGKTYTLSIRAKSATDTVVATSNVVGQFPTDNFIYLPTVIK